MSVLSDHLRNEFASAHGIFQGVIADIPEDSLHSTLPGSTVGTPASIIAHAVLSEDFIANNLVGRATLYESAGWKERVGVEMPGPRQNPEWAAKVRITPVFFDYAKAVFENTENVVGGMTEADLARKIPGIQGETTVSRWLAVGVIHVAEHSGELAAVKGVQGLRGLPF